MLAPVCADAVGVSAHTGNPHPDGATGAFYRGVSGYAKSDVGFSYVELRFLNASALNKNHSSLKSGGKRYSFVCFLF
jgi:hypothetical protein